MSDPQRDAAEGHEVSPGATLDSLLDPHVLLRGVRDSDGCIVDFVYVDANRAACEYNRMSKEELIGRRLLGLLPGHAGSGLLEKYFHVVETGEPLILDDFVYPNETAGSDRHYDIRAVKVGDLLSYTWRDVTEWNELLERFRLLAESASDIVYQTDADWVITWVSPSVKRELGWDTDDLLGHRPLEYIHSEDSERVNAYRDRLYAGTLDVEETVDVRFRRPDGGYHWFSVKASVVVDDGGAPGTAVVSLRSCQREMMIRRALRTLSAGGSILVRAMDEESLLQEMCQMAVNVGGYAFSWFGTPIDDARGTVEKVAASVTHRSYLDAIDVSWRDNPLGQGPTGTALRDDCTSIAQNIADDARMKPWRAIAVREGLSSSIALPVRVDGEMEGVLTVYALEANAFDERTVHLLEDLASQLGYGIGRLRERTRLIQALDDQTLLVTAIDRAEESFITTNPENLIVYANPSAVRTSGYSLEELLGKSPRIFKSGFQNEPFYQSLWEELLDGRSWRGVLVNKRKNGELYEEYTTISPIHDSSGELMAYVAVKRDLTAERRLEADLTLRNRDQDAVGSLMREVEPSETLEETAAALCRAMRGIDGIDGAYVVLLRPGGQSVPIGVAPEFRSIADAVSPIWDENSAALAERTARGSWWMDLRNLEPFRSNGPMERALEAGFVGLLRVPIRTGREMVAYLAIGTKDHGYSDWADSRLAVFDELGAFAGTLFGAQAETYGRSESIRRNVQSILDTMAYHPVFQPIVDLATGETVGYEALTRFDDGTRPDLRFIEASSVGLQSALEIACAETAVRSAEHLPPNAWLSLNFSPETAMSGGAAHVAARSSRPLAIEVTEHAHIDDYESLRRAIRAIPAIKLFVDDAGAGYAGLAHILALEPDVVKLDISLVRFIDRDPARQALVSGMRFFAEKTGITLLAEGVETHSEAATLRELGVDLGQGYLFGKPAPAASD
jgi:PAS domain S-box-containing protein